MRTAKPQPYPYAVSRDRRMYKTDEICRECGSRLYLTRLEGRLFCKKCREYKTD